MDGGIGDDTISLDMSAYPYASGFGSFDVMGGLGNDVITATLYGRSLQDVSVDLFSDIDGGGGADTISLTVTNDPDPSTDSSTTNIDGGSGDDVINADIITSSNSDATANVTVAGGVGDDMINLRTITDIYSGVSTIGNTITGDGGSDTIYAYAEASYLDAIGAVGSVFNNIKGGASNDVITGEIASTITGVNSLNILSGGSGSDVITAIGGQNNDLDGGTGNDTIIGSANDDNILGGGGFDRIIASDGLDSVAGGFLADTFVFDTTTFTGTTYLTDWERDRDILEFAGIADTGLPGLVDDLDGLGVFNDIADDVRFILNSGGEIWFMGQGTGSVSSVGDLIDDPLSQLA